MTHTSVVLAGRYRLDGRMAVGGVGEVWRALDLVLSRPVAVKLLRPEYAQHPETLARFRSEARHAASVTHRGIAQVYDYGDAGATDSPYLVMELVDGPSLAMVLAAGPLDPGDTMDVLAQAAAGLQAAHEAGLVHRDIKPANLLVGPDGEVKITDFGIAYAAGAAPITRAGTLVGTPAYLAPERVAGGPATPATDLYALGVVGYECLTGRPPFIGMPIEVAAAHQGRELPPLPAAVPPGVAGLIGELTAKDPAARPASAGEVARRAWQLHDALAEPATAVLAGKPGAPPGVTRVDAMQATRIGPPVPAGPPAAAGVPTRQGPRQDRRPPRRGMVLAAVAAVVVAALASWLLSGPFADAPARPQPAASPAARTSSSPAARTPAARTVQVTASALTGQPVGLVSQRLRQLGLRPHVVWTPDGGQPPGTVISVQPSGQVPVGSTVTVTAALRPPGQRHGHGQHGHGGGQGGGNGQGDGNGGG